jgi:16S rRNA (uracil1498-N3)-methyltransferase
MHFNICILSNFHILKMALAQFYYKGELKAGGEIWLDEDTVRHVLQVLRMQAGERIQLTNGEGFAGICVISKAEKKKCSVVIEEVDFHKQRATILHLCVAFTKNNSRNEWLLEKATELGVSSITPLMAGRSERERIRYERWNSILVSALLQSQQYYLPVLHEATPVKELLIKYSNVPQKLLGHCITGYERKPLAEMLKPALETVILIGPEGDFTEEEVNLCMENGYKGVSMGMQRLRTETAAMAGCAYFSLVNG